MAKDLRFPRINSLVLSGRLTRDVDLRYTPAGTPIAKLSVAFDRRVQKNGNWETETSYIDVIAWEQKATQCAENLTKGSAIIVEGRLQTRIYTNNEGKNIKIAEIVSNRIHFLEWTDKKNEYGSDSQFENIDSGSTFPSDDNPSMDHSETSIKDDVPF
ncbi:MAG: single-stranded DNA-binding protein [Candidatus Cloacimonetes bacterium]|nr:single-stranded DNA-binding protein [Candidatus Cloacimonadota bacterium]